VFVLVLGLDLASSLVNDVTRGWPLGRQLCDAWVSFDVLCCTASILHLVAISLDRYWAVTRVDYIHNRSGLFLPPDAVCWRGICNGDVAVCFSVRLSR